MTDTTGVQTTAVRTAPNAAFFVSALLAILVFVPFSPFYPSSNLDSSWMYAMNVAVGQKLQFGKDLIFTFGPLAAVYTHQYYPATDTMMLLTSAVIVTSLFLCYAASSRSVRQLPLLGLPVLLSQCYQPDPILLGLPFFLLVAICLGNEDRREYRWTVLVGAAAMSLLPLVKGSTTPAVAVFGAVALISLYRRSRTLATHAVLIFIATMLLVWLVTGQSLANLPAYFINQLPIISGYANAMSSTGSAYEFAGYLLCSVLLIGATYSFVDRSRPLMTVMSAFYLFLCLKAGFIRGDGHVLEAAFALILYAYFLCLHNPRKASVAIFGLCLAAWWLTSNNHIDVAPETMADRFFGDLRASVHGIHHRLVEGRKEYDANLANTNRELRTEVTLPVTTGDADVYSVSLSTLFANGIKWRPRPILQSYSAYTPKLADLNNKHLRELGPSRVFFDLFPIDYRYPALEDGESWLTLMGWYQPAGLVKSFAFFDRSATPHPVTLSGPVGPRTLVLGTSTQIPDVDAPLFAKIDVQPTLFGKILSALYKSPQLHMAVTYADGKTVTYRYVAGMGPTGFILSPTVSTSVELLALQSPNWKEYLGTKMPVSMKIMDDSSNGFAWKREASIQLYKISMAHYAGVDDILFPKPVRIDTVKDFLPAPDCNIDHINDVDPGTQPLRTGASVLHVEGWAMISSKLGTENDGVSIALVYPDGHALAYPANKTNRQDVGVYFHHPDAKLVGYDAVINIQGVERPADIRILQTLHGKTYISDRTVHLE